MQEIIKNVNDHNKKIQEQLERSERLIEYHQKRIKKLQSQKLYWIDGFVKPLAEKIEKKINLSYEIYGPFGLDNETCFYFENCDVSYKLILYPIDFQNGKINYWNWETREQTQLPLDIDEIIKLLRTSEK